MKTTYCLGFVFSSNASKVLLIEKPEKPGAESWRSDCSNGVGGKLVPREEPRDAMSRELNEEAGIADCPPHAWHAFGIVGGPDWQAFLFTLEVHPCLEADFKPFTSAEGTAKFYDVANLPANIIPNCRWMIQMALSFRYGERARSFSIQEQYDQVT